MRKTLLAALVLAASTTAFADMEQAQLAFKKGDHQAAI